MSEQQPWAGGPPEPQQTPPTPPSKARPVLLILTALVLVGLTGWFVMARKGEPTVAPAAPPAEPVAARPEAPEPAAPPSVPMAESDARTLELARGLSSDPAFSKWLGVEGLIQRFTTAVNNIADGESPRMALAFLAPEKGFEAQNDENGLSIDPRSYGRYDTVARVIGSIDAQTAARVYGELKPLIDGAYAEIAPPGQTFERTFGRAIQHLLDVPVPEGDVALVERGALFAFEDPRFEGLSPAQKHLLRMGPENMEAVQAKLRELQGALNLPRAGR